MPSLTDLLAQKAALEKQILDAQREEKSAAIARIRGLMSEFGLTAADIAGRGGAAPRRTGPTGKVAPKYRNPVTGETWTGRGLQPKWLKNELAGGRKLSEFTI